MLDSDCQSDQAARGSGEPPIADVLLRVGEMATLLDLICDCGRADRPWNHPEQEPHLWICPAGAVEFWCTRHPKRAASWLETLTIDPPPEPVW
jgi:hypothetical protein